MAPVNVILIRGVDNFLAVCAGGDIFHFEVSGREQFRCAAAGGDGVQVNPASTFPRKNNAIANCPDQLILRDHFVEDAAAACIGVPKLLALAGGSVGDSNGPGLSFATR